LIDIARLIMRFFLQLFVFALMGVLALFVFFCFTRGGIDALLTMGQEGCAFAEQPGPDCLAVVIKLADGFASYWHYNAS